MNDPEITFTVHAEGTVTNPEPEPEPEDEDEGEDD